MAPFNENRLDKLQQQFVDALDTQEELVDEIQALHHSQRWDRGAILALIFAVILSLVAGAVAIDASRDVNATTVEACRIRNVVPRSTREAFVRQYDELERLFPDSDSRAVIDSLRDSLPPAGSGERDCDGDGLLRDSDYPVGVFAPIEAPVVPGD